MPQLILGVMLLSFGAWDGVRIRRGSIDPKEKSLHGMYASLWILFIVVGTFFIIMGIVQLVA